MSGDIRKSIAAGKLYPSEQSQLIKIIDSCFLHQDGPGKLVETREGSPVSCIVVPHDTLERSGSIAAHAYHRIPTIEVYDTIILVGPAQKNSDERFIIYPSGVWETPLGKIEVDEDTCKQIANDFSKASLDSKPHLEEDSLEVQIPFLQHLFKRSFKMVPILISSHNIDSCIELGKVISKIAKEKKVLVVGISNLTQDHIYAQVLQKDAIVFDKITKPSTVDMKKLYILMKQKNVEISGYGPLTVVVTIAQQLGAKKTESVKYSTSGQTTGDYSSVTGYCSMAFVKSD